MSRDVEVFRIVDVSQPLDDSAVAAPENRESGERAHQDLALWTPACQALSPAGARGTGPMIELEHVTLPETLDSRLVLLSEPGSERARSYRLLRHRLFCHSDPRIIAVTSAYPGEGKTTCALNLALAMAEDTMTHVLLVDANLRRPALGPVLGFAPCESLVENITRFADVGPPYPVASISGTRLHVAALPEMPFDGARLDRTLFAVALCDLRDAYDYVVIDAGSVLESADVDVVGECSSGVIVAARAGRSRKGGMRRAIAQLAPAPVLGSVLIDA